MAGLIFEKWEPQNLEEKSLEERRCLLDIKIHKWEHMRNLSMHQLLTAHALFTMLGKIFVLGAYANSLGSPTVCGR